MSFIAFIFILFLLIVLIGANVIIGILRVLFGLGTRRGERPASSGGEKTRSGSFWKDLSPKRKKLIPKDEGEYVDFEEVDSDQTPSN
ncbi:MAG: DUF4834 family protein [Prevotellaceae bacterium]|jgi:hypothetical protein|nr:DUF4834 family protein [Prevotellaceae bacterium]